MIGQPENHCSFSLFCGYSVKKKTPYLWVLSCLYLILFKNRPIVPDATLDQVDPLVHIQNDVIILSAKGSSWVKHSMFEFFYFIAKHASISKY